MRALFAFIGYLSTATVLTALLGAAYLWQTDHLDDEKVFRVMALLHDIDIDQIAEQEAEGGLDTPPEEPSLEDLERARAVVDRDYEVKMSSLKQGRFDFDRSLQNLIEQIRRFEELTADVDRQLKQQGELSSKEEVEKVVRDLVAVRPDVAKSELLKFLEQPDGMDDVILLMNAMPTGALNKILRSFREQDELEQLFKIHQARLARGQQNEALQRVLEQAKSGSAPR